MQNVLKPFGERAIGLRSVLLRSARARLTFVYVVILAVILFLSSSIAYSIFSQRLERRFETLPPRAQRLILLTDPIQPTAEQLRGDLIDSLTIVNAILLTLAGIASYWLAGLTLEPVEEAYDRQRRFLGDASHELRTPLAILQTDLENELHQSTDEKRQNSIRSKLEETGRMSKLIDNLLMLSRLDEDEREHPQLRHAIIDVRSIIADCVGRLEQFAKQRGIKIGVRENETTRITLDTNQDLFVDAVQNVIKNAIVYSKDGGEVTISINQHGRIITIRVDDRGVGIPEHDLPHVFERFYRSDKSRSRESGGSGLGLAIVRSIMHKLHGEVSIKSREGKGTSVTLCFPTYVP